MTRNEDSRLGFQRPQQERSRRTLARIADATEALLRERGPDQITVQNVVSRADSSVGAFYTRFRSRDDAVAYVHQRFWGEVHCRWSDFLAPESWIGVPAAMLIAEVVRRYCRVFLSDAGRGRAFLLELLTRQDEFLLARLRTLHAEIAAMMGRLLEARREELNHPCPAEAAEKGFRVVLAAVRDHVLFGDEDAGGERPAPDDGGSRGINLGFGDGARTLVLSLTQMYGGLLGIEAKPADYGELLEMCAAARRRQVQ